MNTTIVIHNYNIFSLKTTRIILGVLGALMLILGTWSIFIDSELNHFPNLFYGIFMSATALFVLSEKSPFSPKVKIMDDYILLKNGFWSAAKKLNWETIQKIEFGSYKIIFHQTEKDFIFKYEADSEVSIQIKKALRAAGEEKTISVTGG